MAAVVKAYIDTGEPIGSKILTDILDNAPSSATIRNEMNELCGMGLLCQPHTSAGRVPTSKGYRIYVDYLMPSRQVTDDAKSFIASQLVPVQNNPQDIPKAAARLISSLTGYASVFTCVAESDVKVKQIELMPVGRRTAVVLLVTSGGYTGNRLCRLDCDITPEFCERFAQTAASKIKRKPISQLNRAALQTLTASLGMDAFGLMPVMTQLFEMAAGANESYVGAEGVTALYNICGQEEVRKFGALVERREPLLSILESSAKANNVIFGNDTGIEELKGKVLITSPYTADGRYCGRIGIIGPHRMNYDTVIPDVDYTASLLTEIMTRAVKDLED